MMSHAIAATREMLEDGKNAIVKDMKDVAREADALLNQVTHATTEEFAAARSRIEANLHEMRTTLSAGSKCAARNAQDYVVHNPWKTAGAVAMLGIIIGILSTRHR
jgi:ElaB/YqjD/DUF883 family membrane-anchored ribosome-binding protein